MKVYLKSKEGVRLCGIISAPKKKSGIGIVICHGFTGSKDQNFIPELAEKLGKDFIVLKFDFSGNGESGGNFEDSTYTNYISDLNAAMNLLRAKAKKICVIGYSMGAAIALFHSARYKKSDYLVLIAPLVKKFKWNENIPLNKKEFMEFTDCWGVRRRLKKKYFRVRGRYDPIMESKKLKIPTLVIAGEKDSVIGLHECRKFYGGINAKKKLVQIKNEDHIFHNRVPADMLKSISEFLDLGS